MNVRTNASKTNIENTFWVRMPAVSPMLSTINSTRLKKCQRVDKIEEIT
jgi:hypothetical protein